MDSSTKFERKLDKITDKLSSIDVTLAAQHESLKEHMRRTELLERQLEPLKEKTASHASVLKFMSVIVVAIIGKVIKDLFK